MFFQRTPEISTCYDLVYMYPWAFSRVPQSAYNNTLSKSSLSYWWVLESSGYLFYSPDSPPSPLHSGIHSSPADNIYETGTRCESTFTLMYNSEAHALDGDVSPTAAEWSLRIYGLQNGLGPWENHIRTAVTAMYQVLLEQYGDVEYPCKPSV